MTQIRDIDYRAPLDPRGENRRFIDTLPAGIYSGFRVQPDGAVGPGVLLTNDGVRIEETVGTTVEVPPGHATMNRYDLIVCRHQYLEAWPNPPARFEVVQGTPSEDLNPPIPELPEHNILLAYGLMRPGETTWSYVFHASAPLWMRNLRQEGDGYHVVCGDQSSILARYDRDDDNALKIFVVESGTVSDGALVELNVPSLTLDGSGIRQLSEHVNDTMTAHAASAIPLTDSAERFEAGEVEAALAELAGEGRTDQTVKSNADAVIQEATDRANAIVALQSYVDDHLNDTGGAHLLSAIMAGAVTGSPFSLDAGSAQEALAAVVGGLNDRALKSGDTFSGDVTFQGKVTLDADDAEDVAFDDYVYFRRMVPPCAAPSDGGWDFCCDHGALRVGVNNRSVSIPIPNIPGAEIVSVGAAMQNTDTNDHMVDVRVLKSNFSVDLADEEQARGNDQTVENTGLKLINYGTRDQLVTAMVTDDPSHDPVPQSMEDSDFWRVWIGDKMAWEGSGSPESWDAGHLCLKGLKVIYRRKKLLV